MASKQQNSARKNWWVTYLVILGLVGMIVYPKGKELYTRWAKAPEVKEVIKEREVIKEKTPTISMNALEVVVDRVIDGDTVYARVKLPLSMELVNQSIRCSNYDAYEMSEVKGQGAKTELENLIKEAQVFIMVATPERDNFGRILGRMIVRKGDRAIDVAAYMAEHNWVKIPKEVEP